MPDKPNDSRDPQGFTPRSSRRASEYAREQGWQMNEEERVKTPTEKQPYDGGTDYDYGARDFGDSAEDTSAAQPSAEAKKETKKNERISRLAANSKAPRKKNAA